ncbi:MAG: hypothetical protein Q8S94_09010 [Pseudohongiella sp.]|nr:hypothetical protein [Pseudohongiella sp.]
MKGDLYQHSGFLVNESHQRLSHGELQFLDFCVQKKLMPKVHSRPADDRDRTGHKLVDDTIAKLPKDQNLQALGTIFTRIFSAVDSDGKVKSGKAIAITDALTATFACLSLASPNRTAAEIPVLSKQRLCSYSENNDELVYFINWRGSKGHSDYRNHILASLAPQVDKALNYFFLASEPARVLCRFYENPLETLESLLGDFSVAANRKLHLSYHKRPSIFQLGYALGFYDIDDCVHVVKEGADPAKVNQIQRASCFVAKPIFSLQADDHISTAMNINTSFSSLTFLFGTTFLRSPFGDRYSVSVQEVQDWWISRVKTVSIPSFPLSYSTGESNIALKNAMFCMLGSWFYRRAKASTRGSGTKQYQASHYAIIELQTLARYVAGRLGSGTRKTTIFEDYGYSAEVIVKPHSLRHFANTLADMSNIPVEVITAWSGRVNSEQTHTYIHSSQDEKADRVRAIINPPNKSSRNIRLISEKELSQVTDLPASLTSTGLCTQELNVMPCNYLNDFVSQCFMCSESCHIAGDSDAIAFLEKDLAYQSARLVAVEGDPRLSNSGAMKRWYMIHSRNTSILSQLVNLMKSQLVGTIIRYSDRKSEFNLTDLGANKVTSVACVLTDSEIRLQRLLEREVSGEETSSNPQLESLLSRFGIKES